MRDLVRVFVAGLCLFSLSPSSAFAQEQNASAGEAWQRVDLDELGMSVELPCAQDEVVKDIQDGVAGIQCVFGSIQYGVVLGSKSASALPIFAFDAVLASIEADAGMVRDKDLNQVANRRATRFYGTLDDQPFVVQMVEMSPSELLVLMMGAEVKGGEAPPSQSVLESSALRFLNSLEFVQQ